MPNRIAPQWEEHLAGGDPRLTENPEMAREVIDAMYDLAEVLAYPVDHHGNVIDLTYVLPPLAYHMALAGARVHADRALIKARPIEAQGVVEGGVEWVGAQEPEVTGATTLADLASMSPAARAAAIQKLGGAQHEPDPDAGWHTKTRISTEEPTDG